MRYPYNNFPEDWNTEAGYNFGDPTSYGFHDGFDINDRGGGNSDLGKPLYAISDGEVTSIHNHTTKPTFGNHIHYLIKGDWGERYIHHAHCQEIFVKIGDFVKEGQKIATIGNSGTEWAHDHFACKKEPTGIDGLATTLERLKLWEDPLLFVNKWIEDDIIIPPINMQPMKQIIIDSYRAVCGVEPSEDEVKNRLESGINTYDLIKDLLYNDGRSPLQKLNEQIKNLTSANKQQADMIKDLHQQLQNCQQYPPTEPIFKTAFGRLLYAWAKQLG